MSGQDKPTQEQIDEENLEAILRRIQRMKDCSKLGMLIGKQDCYILSAALREAQAEVARLREIVEADTAVLKMTRSYINNGKPLPPLGDLYYILDVGIDAALKLREGKKSGHDGNYTASEGGSRNEQTKRPYAHLGYPQA